MGLFSKKKKETKFVAWLKAHEHMAEVDPGDSGYAWRLSGRHGGERLWIELSEEQDFALAGLGHDMPPSGAPKGLELSRPDASKLRDALAQEEQPQGPLPQAWALESEQGTLFPYMAVPKATNRLLTAVSQRVRTLSLDGKGLAAGLHLPKEHPERIADDLPALLELLKFTREPKEDEEPKPEEAAPAETPPTEAAAPGAPEQLELGAPAPAATGEPAKVDEKPVIPKNEYLGDGL